MSADQCPTCDMLASTEPFAQTALWAVHPRVAPTPSPGWATIYARRHVPGIEGMNDAETASFGPALVAVQRAMLAVTGAERVYAVSINDPVEHFHVHMVPRYKEMPVSWAIFDRVRQLRSGELATDDAQHERLSELLRSQLDAHPLPS